MPNDILKRLMESVFLIASTTFPLIALSSDSHCYSIKNRDQKNYCIALAKQQGSYCYSIQESDSKNLCLAQVKNQPNYCYNIKSSDSKNQCLSSVR